ncbi:MAG: hypothetical protein GY816_23375 [Cytophagales bacterium]|nr:hypothetical protein [Cytophagales bacterium]
MNNIHGLEQPPREKWKDRAERAEGLLVQRNGIIREIEERHDRMRTDRETLRKKFIKIPRFIRWIFGAC